MLYEARIEVQKQLDSKNPQSEKLRISLGFTEFMKNWLEMMRNSVEKTTFSSYQVTIEK